MALHTVSPADDQDCTVQHLQRPLHLAAEVHMPRRIQKGHLQIAQRKPGLLGDDRNAPALFKFIRIQKGRLVIHTAPFPNRSGQV